MKANYSLFFLAVMMVFTISSCDLFQEEAPIVIEEPEKPEYLPVGDSFRFLRVGNHWNYQTIDDGMLKTSDSLNMYLFNMKQYYSIRKMRNLRYNRELDEKDPKKVYEELFHIKNVDHVLVGKDNYRKIDTLIKLNPPAMMSWIIEADSTPIDKYPSYDYYQSYSYFGPFRFREELTVTSLGTVENVEVPAGKFECNVFSQSTESGNIMGTIYFNNSVGMVKNILTLTNDSTTVSREILMTRIWNTRK